MDAARAGQKSITGTAADLRKLGMQEARQRLLEMSNQFDLGLTDEMISSEMPLIFPAHNSFWHPVLVVLRFVPLPGFEGNAMNPIHCSLPPKHLRVTSSDRSIKKLTEKCVVRQCAAAWPKRRQSWRVIILHSKYSVNVSVRRDEAMGSHQMGARVQQCQGSRWQ